MGGDTVNANGDGNPGRGKPVSVRGRVAGVDMKTRMTFDDIEAELSDPDGNRSIQLEAQGFLAEDGFKIVLSNSIALTTGSAAVLAVLMNLY